MWRVRILATEPTICTHRGVSLPQAVRMDLRNHVCPVECNPLVPVSQCLFQTSLNAPDIRFVFEVTNGVQVFNC